MCVAVRARSVKRRGCCPRGRLASESVTLGCRGRPNPTSSVDVDGDLVTVEVCNEATGDVGSAAVSVLIGPRRDLRSHAPLGP